MKKKNTKSIREQLTEITLSEEQHKHLKELAGSLLKLYDTLTLEEVIQLGLRKSPNLNRPVMTSWGAQWLTGLVERGWAEKIEGCYDSPVFKILVIG